MSQVSQPVLELLPVGACSVGPSADLMEGPDGGVVFVSSLATFSYGARDEAGRRFVAVQLAPTKVAPAVEVASAFGPAWPRYGDGRALLPVLGWSG